MAIHIIRIKEERDSDKESAAHYELNAELQ